MKKIALALALVLAGSSLAVGLASTDANAHWPRLPSTRNGDGSGNHPGSEHHWPFRQKEEAPAQVVGEL